MANARRKNWSSGSPAGRTKGLAVLVSLWFAVSLNLLAAATAAEPPAAGGTAEDGLAPLVAGVDFHVTDPGMAELVAILLDENPRLLAARAAWRSAKERAPQAGALPDPLLSYRYFARTPETRVGPQEHGLELSQTVPWRGKLGSQAERAEHMAATSMWEVRDLERAFIAELKRAWFDALYVQEALAVNTDERELLRRFEQIALTRYATGDGIQQNVIRVQTEINRLADREVLLRRQLDVAGRRIAELIGQPGAEISLSTAIPGLPAVSVDPSAAERLAEQAHPLVLAAQSRIEAGEAWARQRELESRPDFRFGLGYTLVGQREDMAGILSPPEDNGKDVLSFMVGINLPIQRGKIRAGIAEAEQSARSAEQALQSTRNELDFAVGDAVLRLESSAERAGLYRDVIVPQAEESLASAEAAYTTGRQGFLDLLDAERVLFEARLTRHRLVADWWIAAADLERALGRAFPGAEGMRSPGETLPATGAEGAQR